MNPKITEKEWLEDFQNFVRAERVQVPEEISSAILKQVHKDLHPSLWFIFAKLIGIHSIVGILSLAICDQFNMSPFRTGISLSEYFMQFGSSACMISCGMIFVGLSILTASIIVRPEELRALRKSAFLQSLGLGILSLGSFWAFGAEFTVSIVGLWILGALLAGVSASELIFRLRHLSNT